MSARDRGPELEVAIASLMAVMNVYTGNQAKLSLQVAEWCHYLGDFALYAIRKAAKWTVTSREKLPSVATFIADVRLAIGSRGAGKAEVAEAFGLTQPKHLGPVSPATERANMPRKPYEADESLPGQKPDSLTKMHDGVIGGRPRPPRPPVEPAERKP
jgi:hypothetical protein